MRQGISKEEAASAFVSREPLDASDRLQIYQRMYVARQLNSLKDGFPKLAQALGNDFPDLARSYLQSHPSHFPAIERIGMFLPGFLRDFLHQPALADLAALEWVRTLAFLSPNAVTLDDTSYLKPATFARTTLRFHPSLSLLRLSEDVLAAWEDGRCPHPGKLCWVVVYRKHFHVLHRRIDETAGHALFRALAGEPMAQVCEVFVGEEAAKDAFAVLASWFREKWIIQS
jgi:hypothetical protein